MYIHTYVYFRSYLSEVKIVLMKQILGTLFNGYIFTAIIVIVRCDLSVPMKKNGCALVAALRSACLWVSRFNTGRQYM